ncbi:sulfatase-like hydrolase/transferase [Pontibacter chitinilyticus]|uniref:sulfatase-like hydrolase/transferase n=1 Tax=Pontibacter chitinilyticus TaxID=2674989 RepID=UPI003219177A
MSMIRKISCLTVCFILFLIFIRAITYGLGFTFLLQGLPQIKRVLLISVQDIALAVGLGGLAVVTCIAFRKHPAVQRITYKAYIVILLLALSWSLVNIFAVGILNTPVNYQLLYYSNLVGSRFVLDLMQGGIFWGVLLILVVLSIGLLLLGKLLESVTSRWHGTRSVNTLVAVVAGVGLLGYFIVGYRYVERIRDNHHDDYGKVANPVFAFASSFAPHVRQEAAMFQDFPADSLQKYRGAFEKAAQTYVPAAPTNPKVKNVILFIMESTPAEYVAGYGSKYNATPTIQQYLSEAVVFKDVYSHSPNSVNALFSMLGSSYPELSFSNIVYEHPDLQWPTLSSELKKQDYRTAFYGFSDTSYMGVNRFLSYRKFDKIIDHKSLPCNVAAFQSDADGADGGKDEVCMVQNFMHWVSQDKEQRPFFAMLWTMQTHWPYFESGAEKIYEPKNPKLNRYLNALHHTDAALGLLLDSLKQNGLAESTLVVVVGDHGEAFGRHGQYGHGSNIYDENVRVPLLFINPLLFSGQQQTTVAGLVDLPVTILDILQYPVPREWQGSSLYNASRTKTTYFFSTWSDYLYGCRIDKYKAIYDVYTNKTAIYDLQQDPNETTNLADKMPALVKRSNNQLAHWVQYNRALLNEAKVMSKSAAAVK